MDFRGQKFRLALCLFFIVLAPSSFATPATAKQPNKPTELEKSMQSMKFYQQADAKLAIGDYDGAIAAYSDSLNLAEPNMQWIIQLWRGWAYMARPETYDKAFDGFEEVIRTKPDATAGYLWRGVLRFLTGKTELARQDLSEAMKRNPTFPDTVAWSYIIGARSGVNDASALTSALARIPDGKDDALYYDLLLGKLSPQEVTARIDFKPAQCKLNTYAAEMSIVQGDLQKAASQFKEALHRCAGSIFQNGWTLAVARTELRALDASPNNQPLKTQPQSNTSDPQAVLSMIAKPTPGLAISSNDRRIALVIGNSKYRNVPKLTNPAHDAEMVAEVLKRTGFEKVTLLEDLDKDATIGALRSFAAEAEKTDWAVIYYAGHGMEVGGVNYLIPVDAKLATDRDITFEAVPLDQIVNAAERADKLRLVILDACRDNPFKNQMRRTLAAAGRSVSRGLAPIEPDPGTLVVYAAKGGEQASDGNGDHGPFATAFVKDVMTPGLEVRRLFDVVRDDVLEATHHEQQPFSYGSISGRRDFYFLPPDAKTAN